MTRLTFADVKASRIPPTCGVCPTDDRLLQWVNDAQERLLYEGKWWGTYGKFRICATEGCITLPPQIATIEAAAVCHQPIPVHDILFEFLESGAGTRDNRSCWPEANQRGYTPVIRDITGIDKNLLMLCDVAGDVGKKVLVLGYDANGNWIRTTQDGLLKDGEVITLSQSPGTLSANLFTSITGIQLPSNMTGQTWLYSKSTADASLIMLGNYQYWETNPSYSRYFIPTVKHCASGCDTVMIEIIGKLNFIPVRADTDYLIIQNIPALKEMCIALMKAENEPDGMKSLQIIAAGVLSARQILDKQLDHFLGSGRRIGMDFTGSSVGGSQPVENFV